MSPTSVLSQFSPEGLQYQNTANTGQTTNGGYAFPFQRRARSASPPKNPNINEKISATLSPKHNRENNTSTVDDLLEDQVMGLQDPLRSQNSIHSRIGSGGLKYRKPIIANTNLFFIGGSTNGYSNRGSMVEDKNAIPSNKMKVLSKAISHYLNGEYGKIMDEEENPPTDNIIENDLCTHDLRDHDVSDANENDITDEGITKKKEVDDWLEDDENHSHGNDNSLENKNNDGFDPFSQISQTDDYYSVRSK